MTLQKKKCPVLYTTTHGPTTTTTTTSTTTINDRRQRWRRKAAMRGKGSNDASSVVWALDVFFLKFLFAFW